MPRASLCDSFELQFELHTSGYDQYICWEYKNWLTKFHAKKRSIQPMACSADMAPNIQAYCVFLTPEVHHLDIPVTKHQVDLSRDAEMQHQKHQQHG